MSPHRVLFLDHAATLGGAEHSLLLLLKHLDRGLWQPHLACPPGQLTQAAAPLRMAVHPLTLPRLRRSPQALLHLTGGVQQTIDLLRQLGVRLLVANTVRAVIYAAPAARLARTPLIWAMRDFWLSESHPRLELADRAGKALLCAVSTRTIANSHATAAHLPCPRAVTVVHNGVEVARFDPSMDSRPFRQQFGIPPDAPLVGTIGRLRPWKGQDRFLRAMARLAQDAPSAHFLIVGGAIFDPGDLYPERLRNLAAELDLGGRTTFTGHLDDVRPALAAMDLFVHPGDPEPFGRVNLEAMAMAKPVLAFAHGALPEIVVDGETGRLVPPGDEAALAEATVSLLRDPDRRQRMGRAGRARVERHFTARRVATEVSAVLEEAVA